MSRAGELRRLIRGGLPWLGVALMPALGCLPEAPPPPARYAYVPDASPEPPDPPPLPPPIEVEDAGTTLSPRPRAPAVEPPHGSSDGHDAPVALDPLGGEEALPAPWPREWMVRPPVAPVLARRVVATEAPVGVLPLGAGRHLIIEASGGIFSSGAHGPDSTLSWTPEITTLEGPITRVTMWGQGILACRGAAQEALRADEIPADALEDIEWRLAGFACGHGGRKTAVTAQGTLLAIDGQRLRVEAPGEAPALWPIPLERPQSLAALDATRLIVIGPEGAVISTDAGEHFRAGVVPPEARLEEVRDAQMFGKASVLAVGVGREGRLGAMHSDNFGHRWWPVTEAPSGAVALDALALDDVGAGVVVPSGGGGTLEVERDGLVWHPLHPYQPAVGSPLTTGRGRFWLPSPRALVFGVNARPPASPVLDQPLWDVIYLHPWVAVGIGADEGLFWTADGGRRWRRLPGTSGARFNGLESPGDGVILAVNGASVWRADLWAHLPQQVAWSRSRAPLRCAAQWISLSPSGEQQLLGCDEGHLLRASADQQSWTWAGSLGAPLRKPTWVDEDRLVALGKEGQAIFTSEDGGLTWRDDPLPDGWSALTMRVALRGYALLLTDGRVAHTAALGEPWVVGQEMVEGARDLYPLPDGASLVLGAEGVFHMGGDRVRHLARVEGGLRMVPTGNGGLMVLTPTSAALLEPR